MPKTVIEIFESQISDLLITLKGAAKAEKDFVAEDSRSAMADSPKRQQKLIDEASKRAHTAKVAYNGLKIATYSIQGFKLKHIYPMVVSTISLLNNLRLASYYEEKKKINTEGFSLVRKVVANLSFAVWHWLKVLQNLLYYAFNSVTLIRYLTGADLKKEKFIEGIVAEVLDKEFLGSLIPNKIGKDDVLKSVITAKLIQTAEELTKATNKDKRKNPLASADKKFISEFAGRLADFVHKMKANLATDVGEDAPLKLLKQVFDKRPIKTLTLTPDAWGILLAKPEILLLFNIQGVNEAELRTLKGKIAAQKQIKKLLKEAPTTTKGVLLKVIMEENLTLSRDEIFPKNNELPYESAQYHLTKGDYRDYAIHLLLALRPDITQEKAKEITRYLTTPTIPADYVEVINNIKATIELHLSEEIGRQQIKAVLEDMTFGKTIAFIGEGQAIPSVAECAKLLKNENLASFIEFIKDKNNVKRLLTLFPVEGLEIDDAMAEFISKALASKELVDYLPQLMHDLMYESTFELIVRLLNKLESIKLLDELKKDDLRRGIAKLVTGVIEKFGAEDKIVKALQIPKELLHDLIPILLQKPQACKHFLKGMDTLSLDEILAGLLEVFEDGELADKLFEALPGVDNPELFRKYQSLMTNILITTLIQDLATKEYDKNPKNAKQVKFLKELSKVVLISAKSLTERPTDNAAKSNRNAFIEIIKEVKATNLAKGEIGRKLLLSKIVKLLWVDSTAVVIAFLKQDVGNIAKLFQLLEKLNIVEEKQGTTFKRVSVIEHLELDENFYRLIHAVLQTSKTDEPNYLIQYLPQLFSDIFTNLNPLEIVHELIVRLNPKTLQLLQSDKEVAVSLARIIKNAVKKDVGDEWEKYELSEIIFDKLVPIGMRNFGIIKELCEGITGKKRVMIDGKIKIEDQLSDGSRLVVLLESTIKMLENQQSREMITSSLADAALKQALQKTIMACCKVYLRPGFYAENKPFIEGLADALLTTVGSSNSEVNSRILMAKLNLAIADFKEHKDEGQLITATVAACNQDFIRPVTKFLTKTPQGQVQSNFQKMLVMLQHVPIGTPDYRLGIFAKIMASPDFEQEAKEKFYVAIYRLLGEPEFGEVMDLNALKIAIINKYKDKPDSDAFGMLIADALAQDPTIGDFPLEFYKGFPTTVAAKFNISPQISRLCEIIVREEENAKGANKKLKIFTDYFEAVAAAKDDVPKQLELIEGLLNHLAKIPGFKEEFQGNYGCRKAISQLIFTCIGEFAPEVAEMGGLKSEFFDLVAVFSEDIDGCSKLLHAINSLTKDDPRVYDLPGLVNAIKGLLKNTSVRAKIKELAPQAIEMGLQPLLSSVLEEAKTTMVAKAKEAKEASPISPKPAARDVKDLATSIVETLFSAKGEASMLESTGGVLANMINAVLRAESPEQEEAAFSGLKNFATIAKQYIGYDAELKNGNLEAKDPKEVKELAKRQQDLVRNKELLTPILEYFASCVKDPSDLIRFKNALAKDAVVAELNTKISEFFKLRNLENADVKFVIEVAFDFGEHAVLFGKLYDFYNHNSQLLDKRKFSKFLRGFHDHFTETERAELVKVFAKLKGNIDRIESVLENIKVAITDKDDLAKFQKIHEGFAWLKGFASLEESQVKSLLTVKSIMGMMGQLRTGLNVLFGATLKMKPKHHSEAEFVVKEAKVKDATIAHCQVKTSSKATKFKQCKINVVDIVGSASKLEFKSCSKLNDINFAVDELHIISSDLSSENTFDDDAKAKSIKIEKCGMVNSLPKCEVLSISEASQVSVDAIIESGAKKVVLFATKLTAKQDAELKEYIKAVPGGLYIPSSVTIIPDMERPISPSSSLLSAAIGSRTRSLASHQARSLASSASSASSSASWSTPRSAFSSAISRASLESVESDIGAGTGLGRRW
jgi:hypothetical protein